MLNRQNTHSFGFTLVELATVISIIGILAIISVFSFGEWQKTTADRTVRSDLNGVVAAMESERNFSNVYPTSLPTSIRASEGVTLTYRTGDTTKYCVEAQSIKEPTIIYKLDSTNGNKTPVAGTC